MSDYSFVFFPYLKTSKPFRFRDLELRDIQDIDGFSNDAIKHLKILSKMFFLRDHLQIQRLSCTVLLRTDDGIPTDVLQQLRELQTVMAYLYSAPRPIFEDTFLSLEHASIYIITPKPIIPIDLEAERHNLRNLNSNCYAQPDAKGMIDGYEGVLNFKAHFPVAEGSRIYPPTGYLWLNIYQDLFVDLNQRISDRGRKLIEFFNSNYEMSLLKERIQTAMTWYNRSISVWVDAEVALVNLVVAFESLLNLKQGERLTEKFKEAIGLLLGDPPRLDSWLAQFYDARSQIVHKGSSLNLRFKVSDTSKKAKNTDDKSEKPKLYGSLVSDGRYIFQLCLSTMLSGALMTNESELSSMLFTNQERFEKICELLEKGEVSSSERLLAIEQDILNIQKYQYREENLKVKTLMGAADRVVRCYLETNPICNHDLLDLLNSFVNARKDDYYYSTLSELSKIQDYIKASASRPCGSVNEVVFSLLDCIWHYTFMPYLWMKGNKS